MDKSERRLVKWWATLVALTLMSFEGGRTWPSRPDFTLFLVIGIAALKIRIVVLHFMEVDQAPIALRIPLELWVASIGIAITFLWLIRGA